MTASAHVNLEARFAAIPEELLYDPAIPAEAVRVYGVLVRHGSDPANCYPGHARIAAFIGKSARSVPAWIKALEDAGWVTRVPRWRRGDEITTTDPDGEKGWEPTSNGYLVYAHKRAEQRGVPAGERVPPRADGRGGSPLENAPKESKGNESQGEQPLFGDAGQSIDAAFDEFWSVYPKKVKKDAARKAWIAAVKRAGSARAIVEGATRYACSRRGQDSKFTAHPTSWLNDGRWADEPVSSTVVAQAGAGGGSLDDWSNYMPKEAR